MLYSMRFFRRKPKGPGVHNPNMIDIVVSGDESVDMYMVASGEWFEEGRSLEALQSKLETYGTYVASGELVKARPDAGGKPVRIVLLYPRPAGSRPRNVRRRGHASIGRAWPDFRIGSRPKVAWPCLTQRLCRGIPFGMSPVH